MPNSIKILWIDDEIEFLKSHVIFLETKGYSITTINSAIDALELLKNESFDIIFLMKTCRACRVLKCLTN